MGCRENGDDEEVANATDVGRKAGVMSGSRCWRAEFGYRVLEFAGLTKLKQVVHRGIAGAGVGGEELLIDDKGCAKASEHLARGVGGTLGVLVKVSGAGDEELGVELVRVPGVIREELREDRLTDEHMAGVVVLHVEEGSGALASGGEAKRALLGLESVLGFAFLPGDGLNLDLGA